MKFPHSNSRAVLIATAVCLGIFAAARLEGLGTRPRGNFTSVSLPAQFLALLSPAQFPASRDIREYESSSLYPNIGEGSPPVLTTTGMSSKGTTQIIYWDFDDDDGNFTGGGSWVWGPPSTPPAAVVNQAWETGGLANYPDNDCSALYSDIFYITSDSSARLVFDQHLAIEEFFDGGNVQISLDGGQTFILLEPVGGYPYPPPPHVDCPEGLDGPVFSGFSEGYVRAVFPIGQYAGNYAILRWVFESDFSINYQGWIIDNVRIFGATRL